MWDGPAALQFSGAERKAQGRMGGWHWGVSSAKTLDVPISSKRGSWQGVGWGDGAHSPLPASLP